MSLRRRPLPAALAVAGAVLLVAAWATVGPRQLGGPASYAVVVGSSMEPKLHRGDLAIVRRQDAYRVGDVVLYRDAQLGGARVLHRIVAIDGDRFRTKGDNNDYVDQTRPRAEDVLGALSFRIGGVGGALPWLQQPWHAALLVALATLVALGGGLGATRGARSRPRRSLVGAEAIVTAALVGAGLASLLAVVVWTRPASQLRSVPGAYVQRGSFDYGARVAPSAVYPDGRVDAGETVFVRLAERLRVAFRYSLDAPGLKAAGGTAGLEAVLSDGRGWERRLELARPRPFAGDTVTLAAALDLKRLRAITSQLQRLTGADVTTYSLRLRADVSVDARLGERPLRTTFAQELPFVVDPVRIALDGQGAAAATLLARRQLGSAERRVGERLTVGPVALGVADTRALSLVALVLSLLAAGWARARAAGGDAPAHERAAARYRHLLLEASVPPARDPGSITELADLESLVRLAERSGRMIVHSFARGADEYVVEDGGAVFRYHTGPRGVPESWLEQPTASAARP